MTATTSVSAALDAWVKEQASGRDGYGDVLTTPSPSPDNAPRATSPQTARQAVWSISDAFGHGDREQLAEVARHALYERLLDEDSIITPAGAFALVCIAANDDWPGTVADAAAWVRGALRHADGAAVEMALVGGLGDLHHAGRVVLHRFADLLDNLADGHTDPVDAGPTLAGFGAIQWGVRVARAVTERTGSHLAMTRIIACVGRELAAPTAAAALADEALPLFPDTAILLTTASRQYRNAGRPADAVEAACRAITTGPSKPWYAANTLRAAAREAGMRELAARADRYSGWEDPQWPTSLVDVPDEVREMSGQPSRQRWVQWVLAARQ